LIFYCIEAVVKLMAPITSHVSDYIWRFLLQHEGNVFDSGLPTVPHDFDMTIIKSKSYVDRLLKNMRNLKKAFLKKNKNKEPVEVRVYIYKEWPVWKAKALNLLKNTYNRETNSFPPKNEILELLKGDPDLESNKSQVMPFLNSSIKEIADSDDPLSEMILELPFDEFEVHNLLHEYIKKELEIETYHVFNSDDENAPDNLKKSNGQPGSPSIFFS